MTISIDQFRQAMQQLAASVFVITTEHEGERAGLTATAVCSLSAEPPRLLVSVNRRGYTFDMISRSRKLAVNILDIGHEAVARAFATAAGPSCEERFGSGEWTRLTTGAPILAGAVVSFDCCVATILDTGSHGVIIADIVDVAIEPTHEPLLYARGQYARLLGEG